MASDQHLLPVLLPLLLLLFLNSRLNHSSTEQIPRGLLTNGKLTVGFIVPPASHIVIIFLPPAAARASLVNSLFDSMAWTPLKEYAITFITCSARDILKTSVSTVMSLLLLEPLYKLIV